MVFDRVVITTKMGSEVRTLNLKYGRKKGAIEKAMLTDGIWMLITNITETTEPDEYRLGPEKLYVHTRTRIGWKRSSRK